nr:unnamed protein product [Callosobruchus chinensis]
MNTLLEPSADASGICPNEVLPHLVDAGHTADHTKPDKFLFGRDFEEKFRAAKNLEKTSKDLGTANFSGKTSAVQKRGGGGSNTPLALAWYLARRAI